MSIIYTIGTGKRTQCAMRADGVWFTRSKWKGVWTAWREHGRTKPYEFGMYIASRAGNARLPS